MMYRTVSNDFTPDEEFDYDMLVFFSPAGVMNSCASGVSVVNIDNGFGAGYLASMINHMTGAESKK